MITFKPATEFKPHEKGVYLGIPMVAYLAMPGVNRSLLSTVADRPSHHDKESESTAAQEWGTLFNDLLFFGTRNYYVQPETYEVTPKATKANPFPETETKPWSGNATVCKEWVAAHQDKPILPATGSHSEDWLNKALMKCLADQRVRALMKDAQFEVTMVGAGPEKYKWPLSKCRPDLVKLADGRLILADLKTTIDGATAGFARQILKFGYHKQAAHCRQILANMGVEKLEYYFIILEKGDDPRVQVRRLADRAMDIGDLDLDDEWSILQRCKISNSWPDFSDDPEPHIIGQIDLPDYLYPSDTDDIAPSKS
jgi:hypothetical protein